MMKENENVSSSNYWNEKYLKHDTTWDIKTATPPLTNWLGKNKVKNEKVCILGCGKGYDAIEFSDNGAQVWAVDFAPEPIHFLQKKSHELNLNIHTICGDLFDLGKNYSGFFTLIWEYTCFCAIDPVRRLEYRDLVYQILAKGGKFISLFFPILKKVEEGGPAYAVDLETTLEMFNEKFEIIEINAKPNSILPRYGNEVLVTMVKRG